mgnify:FL=1
MLWGLRACTRKANWQKNLLVLYNSVIYARLTAHDMILRENIIETQADPNIKLFRP